MLGAVNAVLSVAAIGQVVTNLDRPANIAGYALGVALGRLSRASSSMPGSPVIRWSPVVLPGESVGATAAELLACGWPVTMYPAHGIDGPSTVLTLVVRGQPRRAG